MVLALIYDDPFTLFNTTLDFSTASNQPTSALVEQPYILNV